MTSRNAARATGSADPTASPASATERRAGRPAVPRLALTRSEAAESLGLSVDAFDDFVRPELRAVYVGRRRVYAVTELQRWLDREATRGGP